MEELLRLTMENNEMLRRILAYIDKVESPAYIEQRQMTSFLINCAANSADRMQGMMNKRNV